jgi:hypothetical protein
MLDAPFFSEESAEPMPLEILSLMPDEGSLPPPDPPELC